jgi:hypothetical protein
VRTTVRADVRHAALCAVVGRADGLGMTTTSEPRTESRTAAGRDNGSEHARIRQLRRRTLSKMRRVRTAASNDAPTSVVR